MGKFISILGVCALVGGCGLISDGTLVEYGPVGQPSPVYGADDAGILDDPAADAALGLEFTPRPTTMTVDSVSVEDGSADLIEDAGQDSAIPDSGTAPELDAGALEAGPATADVDAGEPDANDFVDAMAEATAPDDTGTPDSAPAPEPEPEPAPLYAITLDGVELVGPWSNIGGAGPAPGWTSTAVTFRTPLDHSTYSDTQCDAPEFRCVGQTVMSTLHTRSFRTSVLDGERLSFVNVWPIDIEGVPEEFVSGSGIRISIVRTYDGTPTMETLECHFVPGETIECELDRFVATMTARECDPAGC
jgi:hypothetical protein